MAKSYTNKTQTNSAHISSLTHHQYEHYLWFHWVE